jgi:hypothetical protein
LVVFEDASCADVPPLPPAELGSYSSCGTGAGAACVVVAGAGGVGCCVTVGGGDVTVDVTTGGADAWAARARFGCGFGLWWCTGEESPVKDAIGSAPCCTQ